MKRAGAGHIVADARPRSSPLVLAAFLMGALLVIAGLFFVSSDLQASLGGVQHNRDPRQRMQRSECMCTHAPCPPAATVTLIQTSFGGSSSSEVSSTHWRTAWPKSLACMQSCVLSMQALLGWVLELTGATAHSQSRGCWPLGAACSSCPGSKEGGNGSQAREACKKASSHCPRQQEQDIRGALMRLPLRTHASPIHH